MGLAEKVQHLYGKFGSLKGVTIEIHKHLVAVAVKNEAASATIFLQGAQLAEYKRAGETPLIWLSEACEYKSGQSLRGGIPICWPWFGDLKRNPQAVQDQVNIAEPPAHGLVRTREWELVDVERHDSETTQVTLQLEYLPDDCWPQHAVLRAVYTIGPKLDVQLTVKNLGAQSFCFTSALHSYFCVSHINQVSVIGTEGATYLDTLEGWAAKTDEGSVTIGAEVDRVYQNLGDTVALADNGLKRKVSLSQRNLPDLVMWNPWIEKGKRLSNFKDCDYQRMLCLESAHLLENQVCLQPNDSHEAALQISVTG